MLNIAQVSAGVLSFKLYQHKQKFCTDKKQIAVFLITCIFLS